MTFFEVSSGLGAERWVLKQVAGLPMGGHLPAAMVELVALHREFLRPWPGRLLGFPTFRYWDNFFAMLAGAMCDSGRSYGVSGHACEARRLGLLPPDVGNSCGCACLRWPSCDLVIPR